MSVVVFGVVARFVPVVIRVVRHVVMSHKTLLVWLNCTVVFFGGRMSHRLMMLVEMGGRVVRTIAVTVVVVEEFSHGDVVGIVEEFSHRRVHKLSYADIVG